MRTFGPILLACLALSAVPPASARVPSAAAPQLSVGDAWTMAEREGPERGPAWAPDRDSRTFWDLRPLAGGARRVTWTVRDPLHAGLASEAAAIGADRARCAADAETGRPLGCELVRDARARSPDARIAVGDRWVETIPGRDGSSRRVERRAVAEGVALVPAGPREVVLLRETESGGGPARLRYRFLDTSSGRDVAEIEGPPPAPGLPFTPERTSVLVSESVAADDGLEIPFLGFRGRLAPGTTGFLQYSSVTDTALSAIHPAWTSVPEMLSIDQTALPYQPDPGDPGSLRVLPEVWDFTGLIPTSLGYRTFNSTRSDEAAATCIGNCSTRDVGPAPPDGTWQAYLKIDVYAPAGTLHTQDYFALNDNDTGADPSIDVPYVQQDEMNTDDRTQVCFGQSAGGAERFLRFFRFSGPDPASATMGVGDTWTSGAWTECDPTHGLKLAAASICGDQCWPGCSSIATPYARGRLPNGAGFRMTVLEDGWVHVPSGNFVPALLLRQDTDLLAGVDFIGACALSPTPNRSFDYFWVSESYGLLATVSSPTSETIAAADWSAAGNVSDGVDVTWGPFPPQEVAARACLAGTRLDWSLPADGSNLSAAPGVAGYGYVVSWGDLADAEALADWSTNPRHTPLPGEAGYLAAPAGAEPTSYVIQGWAGASLNATVVTALRYTDPDVSDQRTFRSAAYFKVSESPARLDAAVFRVGDAVVPFTSRAGADIALSWPAVPGAASYLVRVYDLATRAAIPCPAGMDCTPEAAGSTHPGAAADGAGYGYTAFAVDPCGATSAN